VDIILYHAAALLFAALLFTWVERQRPAEPGEQWWRRPLGIDLTYWFASPVLNQLALLLALVVIGLGLLAVLGDRLDRTLLEQVQQGRGWIATWPVWGQAVAAFIVADLTLYWIHRAFHRVPFLWAMHAVHHSPTRLDWLAAVRSHPLNTLLSTVVLGGVLVGLGFPPAVLAGVLPLIGLLALLGHANVRWEFGPGLRFLIASPTFHRWHHTHIDEGGDRNFASFLPLWDRLFGTWYLPLDRRPTRLGIGGDPVPYGFLRQLNHPLRVWSAGWNLSRSRRWLVAGLTLVAVMVVLGALITPLATLQMQIALPRVVGDVQITGYRRGPVAAAIVSQAELLRFDLPRSEAHRWFMAAAGALVPAQAADPGAHLWGDLRQRDLGAPLPALVVSQDEAKPPRMDARLATARVNAWLARGALQDDSPWVLRLDPGATVMESSAVTPAPWQRTLVLSASGLLARRDGQPGLIAIDRLRAPIDVRCEAVDLQGTAGTRLTFRLRIDDLALTDRRTGEPLVIPSLLWHVIAAQINLQLAAKPVELALVIPPTTGVRIVIDEAR